eukprot:TRINITY_DN1442_c0_g1_i4.p2 TRINITY_DN1442_c0_g1~~TRINITY_DN1442_c0_g1_i4.p2  ORF type:complete len:251 (-),score=68.88 TRINITY_DN1442_c0_g1_i4:1828-2580(-)
MHYSCYPLLIVIFFLVVLSLVSHGVEAECMHDHIVDEMDMVLELPIAKQDYAEQYPTSSNTRPIRILVDTSALMNDKYACSQVGSVIVLDGSGTKYICTKGDILTQEQYNLLLNNFLPAATQRLQSALSVIPPTTTLKLKEGITQCGYGPMVTYDATKYNTVGVDYDLVLFITSRPVQQAGVIAFGTACQQDQFGRPIAGQLNFNPSYVDTKEASHPEELGTCIHEMSHVLGFSASQFQYFNIMPSSGRS